MTYLRDFTVRASDSASADAFGRWRVSSPAQVFDSKQIFTSESLFWDDQEVSGSGTSSTHSTDTARSRLSVSASTAGLRVRQTFRRFHYQPGKSQLVLMTGLLDAGGGGTGITRRIGFFDDDNGLFFEDAEGTVRVVRRSSTSGSPVDTAVEQSAWNVDKMDGSGPSGITVDWTKAQMFVIDFEWLGVGRVRFGLDIDGQVHYVHNFLHANNLDVVYLSTPNLPLRFSIENDGTGAASDLDQVCAAVESEGGVDPSGLRFWVDTGVSSAINANTVGTFYAVIGLRLKPARLGAQIDIKKLSLLAATNDDFLWRLYWNPTVAGTFTYGGVASSNMQRALGDQVGNPSATTVTGGTVIAGGYVTGNTTFAEPIESELKLGASIAGVQDELVLAVSPQTSNLDIYGGIGWRELT